MVIVSSDVTLLMHQIASDRHPEPLNKSCEHLDHTISPIQLLAKSRTICDSYVHKSPTEQEANRTTNATLHRIERQKQRSCLCVESLHDSSTTSARIMARTSTLGIIAKLCKVLRHYHGIRQVNSISFQTRIFVLLRLVSSLVAHKQLFIVYCLNDDGTSVMHLNEMRIKSYQSN